MQPFFTLATAFLITVEGSLLREPILEADPQLFDVLCDVRGIFRDVARLSVAESSHSSFMATRILVVRLPDLAWEFRVFLGVRRAGRQTMWRLRATTCERAARRAAFKLVLASESSQGAVPPVVRVRATMPSAAVQPSTATPPVIQRPSLVRTAEPPRRPAASVVALSSTRHDASVMNTALPSRAEASDLLTAAEPTTRRSATERRSTVDLRVRVNARTGYGLLPQGLFGGGQVHAALRVGRARVELGVSVSNAGPLVLTDVVRRRPLHVGLLLHACGELTRGSIDLRLCLGVEGGLITVKHDVSRWLPWTMYIHGSPSITWWLHRRVGLYSGIAAGPALVRTNFYAGPGPGADAIAQQSVPAWLLACALGLEFRVGALRTAADR